MSSPEEAIELQKRVAEIFSDQTVDELAKLANLSANWDKKALEFEDCGLRRFSTCRHILAR